MAEPDIPKTVWRFLADNIDTVPQLETLLLLSEHQGRSWSAQQVAARIYVKEEVARDILRTLQQRLLLVAESDPPSYRYLPPSQERTEQIREVADAYRRHLVPIATFIHSRASASVREFARAFEIKKER